EVQEVVEVVTAAKLVYEVTASSETVTAISVIIPAAEPQVPAATIIAAPTRVTAALSRKRKGVVIRDPKSNLATSSIIFAKTKSKDKEKAAKRRRLNEEVEDLKRHLEIVPNEDDDVYTKATPLARKKCIWSSKGQKLEATGIMWCADHNIYYHTTDFVSGDE
nr:hypothetical protein [Tanacetum cinerariifolium]